MFVFFFGKMNYKKIYYDNDNVYMRVNKIWIFLLVLIVWIFFDVLFMIF